MVNATLNAALNATNECTNGKIFCYFSTPALSILVALVIGVLTATLVACYFDLKSRQAGLNKLPEGAQWVHIPKKRLEAFRTSLRESSKTSKEEELPLLTPKDPSARSLRTPSKAAASRLDQEEKHKRMIEAVYIASGRAVPTQFASNSSTRTAVNKSIRPKSTVPKSNSIVVEKTQSLSGSVRTMPTLGSEMSDDNTQRSTVVETPQVAEPTPEQIERASLAFVREIEKTPATAPTAPPSDPK